MAEQAVPGVRVKVRFAGQDVDGFVVERVSASEHDGRLAPLRRAVGAEPVLTPAIAELCGRIAERYAGVSSDVRRLAVPPRHATAEKQPSPSAPALGTLDVPEDDWAAYPAAPAFLRHLRTGGGPRAVWDAAPGEDWPRLLAQLAAATLAGGRGTVICVPDHRDVARVDAALLEVLGPDQHVTLQAEAGPGPRYREFLLVSRGARRIVVGTRSAAFAPVHDLGLVVIWDDGDDLHAEPRAPYPHTREVLLERAGIEDCAVLVGSFSRSVEADQLLQTGWAKEISAPRPTVRDRALIGVAGPGHRPRSLLRRRPGAHGGARRGAVGPRARSGAGADPAGRLRPAAGLRTVPHPGPVLGLHRPAAAHRSDDVAALSLVRHRGTRLGLCRVRWARAAGTGDRRRPHRRRARPRVRAGPGGHLQRRPGARRGRR